MDFHMCNELRKMIRPRPTHKQSETGYDSDVTIRIRLEGCIIDITNGYFIEQLFLFIQTSKRILSMIFAYRSLFCRWFR